MKKYKFEYDVEIIKNEEGFISVEAEDLASAKKLARRELLDGYEKNEKADYNVTLYYHDENGVNKISRDRGCTSCLGDAVHWYVDE